MRQVVCDVLGCIDNLVLREVPPSQATDGHVVVDVEFAAASFVDTVLVKGLYQVDYPVPYVPGSAVAGTVSSIGPGVTGVDLGAAVVAALEAAGGFADQVVVPAEVLIPRPPELAADLAVASLENYATMTFALQERARLRSNEWLVVLGAGGAIGLAAVDIARFMEANVVAFASSDEKRELARRAGANIVLGYEDMPSVRDITDGGADVVIDPVGGDIARAAVRVLARAGRYCVLGFASGEIPQLPANRILFQNRQVIGVDFGDLARRAPMSARAFMASAIGRIARGELQPPQPTRMPLESAASALNLIANRKVPGKIVLEM